jgi:ubiquinone biosynthesis protein UbiJ
VLAETLQRVLNRYVSESTAARERLQALEGSSFAIEVAGTGLSCVLSAANGALHVAPYAVEPPTARLRAAPLDLLKLARSGRAVAGLRKTHAEITGDLHVAESFGALLELARPDLEEVLAGFVGDIAAHEIGRAAADGLAWLTRAARSFEMNTAEYLQEESRALPAALEAQAFYDDVERLRDDVERAAARLARLEQRAAACAASDSF